MMDEIEKKDLKLLTKADIKKLRLDEKILVHTLCIYYYCKKYIFTKNYYGPIHYIELARRLNLDEVYSFFKNLQDHPEQLEEISDNYPFFRRTYHRDFIDSILIQIDLFIYKKHLTPAQVMPALIGCTAVLSPFNIDVEIESTLSTMRKYGISSIRSYLNFYNNKKIRTHPRYYFKSMLYRFFERNVDQLIRETATYNFPFYDLFEHSSLTIHLSDSIRNNFYSYTDCGRGTFGFCTRGIPSISYVKTSMLKETVPGKHLYTLLREFFSNNRPKYMPLDALTYLEPELSPEKLYSDSLPFCAKLLFPKMVDLESYLALEMEKLYCKLMYNGWYYRYIDRTNSVAKYFNYIAKLINIDNTHLKFKAKQLFEMSKYSMAFIPCGIYLIENIIRRCTTGNILWFYNQQSYGTIEKLVLWQNKHLTKEHTN